jgi:hypothetical protein
VSPAILQVVRRSGPQFGLTNSVREIDWREADRREGGVRAPNSYEYLCVNGAETNLINQTLFSCKKSVRSSQTLV